MWNFNWDAAAAETSLGEAPLCFMNVWNKERQRGPSFSCSQESWAETESLDDCKGRRRAEVQNNDCRREEHIYTCTALFHCRWRNHVSSSSMLSPLVAVGPLQNIYSHSNASYPVLKGPVPYSLKTEALGLGWPVLWPSLNLSSYFRSSQSLTRDLNVVELLCFGFAPSSVDLHRLRFECSTAGQLQPWDWGVPVRITEPHKQTEH